MHSCQRGRPQAAVTNCEIWSSVGVLPSQSLPFLPITQILPLLFSHCLCLSICAKPTSVFFPWNALCDTQVSCVSESEPTLELVLFILASSVFPSTTGRCGNLWGSCAPAIADEILVCFKQQQGHFHLSVFDSLAWLFSLVVLLQLPKFRNVCPERFWQRKEVGGRWQSVQSNKHNRNYEVFIVKADDKI